MNKKVIPQNHIEHTLGVNLKAHGITLSVSDIRLLVEGQLAAPKNIDPHGWIGLIEPNASEGLRKALQDFMDYVRGLTAEKENSPTDRIAALRVELCSRGLDGFLVPLADEHQSEFPPKCSQRLAWLTGFTGSAGIAVVLKDAATILVDGRYTLQVGMQTDGKIFEILNIPEGSVDGWLNRHAPSGSRIGFDPWLHTNSDLARLKEKCGRIQVELVQVDTNPVDEIWNQQPPPPLAPVYTHPKSIAGRSIKEKIHETASIVRKNGADAAILTSPDSIAWLLNIRGGDLPNTPVALGFAILNRNESVELFMDHRKILRDTREALENSVSLMAVEKFGERVNNLCGQQGSIQLSPHTTPFWVSNQVLLAGGKIIEKEDPCVLPKACKNVIEIQGIRNAHIRDGVALCRFLAWLSEAGPAGSVDEITAANRLYDFRKEMERFRGLSFETISGAGPNGAIVHYRVTPETNRRLELGSLYLVDSGAQYIDGTTDVTRTIAIGSPSDEMRDRFTRVLKGHAAMAMVRFPMGTSGGQLDILARQALWDIGLDFNHGTGHGVGAYLGVHEGPQRIAKRSAGVPLRPGMVVSNEPGYYKEGAYGIRIENLQIVRKVAIENFVGNQQPMLEFEGLTLAPIDISLIDRSLLTADEISWLNRYHTRVCSTIGPFLDVTATNWLEKVTQPLECK